MNEINVRDYVKKGCQRHKQQEFKRVCISPGCITKSAFMCESCYSEHDHDESISLRVEQVYPLANFKVQQVHSNVKDNVLRGLKKFRGFAVQVRKTLDIMLSDVFEVGEKIYERYEEYLQNIPAMNNLIGKNGEQLRQAYFTYLNLNKQALLGELPKKLIARLLEYKVALGQLLPRLKELVDTANMFSLFTTAQKQDEIKRMPLTSLFEQFEGLFQFPNEKSNPKYEEEVRQLKRLNSIKQHDKVLIASKEIIDDYPLLYSAYFEKAFAEFEKTQYSHAFVSYSTCYELGGPQHVTQANRGICLIRLGFLQRGIECCDIALQSDQSYANAFCHKGIAYEHTKKQIEAIACYERAALLKPGFKIAEDRAKALRQKLRQRDQERANRRAQISGSVRI